MENKEKIIVVYSFGGEYEDKWENPECAFLTKEAADKYMKEQIEKRNKISDDLFEEIEEYLTDLAYELECKYYDPNTCELYKGKTAEEWENAYNEFENVLQYEAVEKKWGFTKEEYAIKLHDRTYGFIGYETREIDLIKE